MDHMTLSARAGQILGRRRDGRPIYGIAGADDRGSALLEMQQERTALLEQLANPPADADVAELVRQAEDLEARIVAHNTAVQAATTARARLLAQEPTHTSPAAPAGAGQAGGRERGEPGGEDRETRGAGGPVTLGRAFFDAGGSEQLASYRAGGGNGRMMLELPQEARALFATTNYPMKPARVPGIVADADQALTVLDLIDRQTMTTSSVEWVQETTPLNAAAEVTEGSAKAEATWAVQLKTDTAATIAHFVNITRQTLDDEGQIRGYLDGRLTYGLMKRLNGQILNGNGTAPNLRGILATSGIGTYAAGTTTEAAVISIRKAKTVAQLSEYDPDGLVINPVDWEAVELSTDNQGEFRVTPSAQNSLTPRIWGLNVVVTTAITGTTFGTTGGTFLVGAFRMGATLWERTGVQVFITDSHASNFTSNILTLLAELRAVLSVWRPKAFVKGTFGVSRA